MRLFALLTALAAPSLLAAAPVPRGLKKAPDVERLVGTWRVTALDGKTNYFVVEADGKCRMTYHDDDETVIRWAWAFGPDESPKRMSLTRAAGRDVYECAYRLDGDSLTIAYPTGAGKPPPVQVARGAGVLLFDLKREPPAD